MLSKVVRVPKGILRNNKATVTSQDDEDDMVEIPEGIEHLKRPETSDPKDSIFRVLQSVILIAQCFSLMPVQGFLGKDSSRLRFSWINIRVFYSLIILIGSFSMVIFSILRLIAIVPTFKHAAGVMFHAFTTMILILFLHLATRWTPFLHKWEEVEKKIAFYGYPKRLSWKIKGLTGLVLTAALIEHVLSNLKQLRHSLMCNTGQNWIRNYFTSYYPQVFNYVIYHPIIAFLVIVVKLIATFSWNFLDLFIIVISLALSERFKQINLQLLYLEGKDIPERTWRRLRLDFNTLSLLTKFIDSEISPIVLLSFGNNLYFICLQLLNTINRIQNLEETIYFYWSFIYLIVRASLVSLYGARIHEESLLPARYLYSVPPESYCVEVERFIQQATSDRVTITGMRFFSLTRNLLLTIAGTIVTYEIVLYQLGSNLDLVNVNENNSTNAC